MALQDIRYAHDALNGLDITLKIVVELGIERRIDRVHRRNHEQRVAIRGSLRDRFRGDIGAGPRTILDDELLTEALGGPRPNEAREDVGRAPRCKAHHEPYRP